MPPPSHGRRRGARGPIAAVAVAALVLLVALAVLLFDRAPAPPADDTSAVRPALWQIADADSRLYLFGTVHALPAGTEWRSPAVDAAIDGSDALILEIADGDRVDALSLFAAMARDEPVGGPLAMRLDDALATPLAEAIRRAGLRRVDLDPLEDWAAALAIGNAVGAKAGFDPARGVEPALDARFRANGRPVTGLETSAGQFAIFDRLPAATQRRLLERAVTGAARAEAHATALVDAWQAGDVDALDALVARDLAGVSGLREPVLSARNRRWAKQLAQRLAAPGTTFVAVGAAHLTGPDSLQAQLSARDGLTVERIQ